VEKNSRNIDTLGGQEDANRVFVLKASHSDNLKLNPLSMLHLSPSAL